MNWIVSPQNLYDENLLPNMIVFEDRASER